MQDEFALCSEGVKKDIADIDQWAQIFECPAELGITVAKHLLLHCLQMKRYISNERRDMADKKFFNAGKDTADALVLAIGPVYKATKDEEAIKIDYAAEDFLQAGVDSADIMTLLLGPVQ